MEDISAHVKRFADASELFEDPEQQKRAEAYLLHFRTQPYAQQVALKVLAATPSLRPTTKFNALNVLRDVLLKNWENLPAPARSAVRMQLFRMAVDPAFVKSTERFVVKQLLQLIAVVYKRAWFDGLPLPTGDRDVATRPSALQSELLQRIERLLTTTDVAGSGSGGGGGGGAPSSPSSSLDHRLTGAELATMIVQEFATSRSVAIGLSLDFHRRCCLNFGTLSLLGLFRLASNALADTVRSSTLSPPAGRSSSGTSADAAAAAQRQQIVMNLLKVSAERASEWVGG